MELLDDLLTVQDADTLLDLVDTTTLDVIASLEVGSADDAVDTYGLTAEVEGEAVDGSIFGSIEGLVGSEGGAGILVEAHNVVNLGE